MKKKVLNSRFGRCNDIPSQFVFAFAGSWATTTGTLGWRWWMCIPLVYNTRTIETIRHCAAVVTAVAWRGDRASDCGGSVVVALASSECRTSCTDRSRSCWWSSCYSSHLRGSSVRTARSCTSPALAAPSWQWTERSCSTWGFYRLDRATSHRARWHRPWGSAMHTMVVMAML